ncbi:MAG: hypothetical protein J5858_08190 [Lentisphaeria bacterium]|nr:hypothetical protein [Lentisphaeria bacterium]
MNTKIPVAKIRCEADRAGSKADDMHLLASIKGRIAKGLKPLLQPIALKKIEGDPAFDYAVDDGRRRFKALVSAGITEIELGQDAVLVDGDSEVNAYVANQHLNLSLAEEIKKLYSMRQKFKTLDALAAEIGHSPTWAARRLNLLNLSELWKKAMAEKTFGYMSVAHYETIATFPPNIQDEIFDYIRSVEGRELKTASIRKFSETLYEKFATLLSSLPWQEEGCGECPACKERKESGYLFANLIPEPRCMNREYLERKRKEYVAALAAKNPETILVSQNYQSKDEEKKDENDPLAENTVLGPGDWRETDKKEDGIPAIIADGPRAGTTITIQRPNKTQTDEPKQVKTLAERREAKNRQRRRRAIEKLITAIKEEKTDTPSRIEIYLMIACKGAHAVCGSHFDFKTKRSSNPLGLPDKIKSFKQLSASDNLDTLIWRSVCENVIMELEKGQSGAEEPYWTEASMIANLVHFDLGKALAEATKELPDPKAWEALARAEEKKKNKTEEEAA